MDVVLLTGKTELFTQSALARLAEEYQVIIAGERGQSDKRSGIRFYHTSPAEEKFRQLFDVYSFRAVIYFTGYAEGAEGSFGEAQQMEQVLLQCKQSKVEKLVVLSSVDSRNYLDIPCGDLAATRREYATGRTLCAVQLEELCRYYAEKTKMCVVILQLPYLADEINDGNFLGQVFRQVYEKKRVTLPFHREDRIDFLSYGDLTELLIQITEETGDESGSYFAISGYQYQYGDLEDILKTIDPEADVVYTREPNMIEWPDYPVELRKRYGFLPMDSVMENICSYYRIFVRDVVKKRESLGSRLAALLLGGRSGLLRYVELVLVFLLMEWISRFTSDSVYFRFVDVRLLFVVIMGTIHGTRLGILAALLECLVLLWLYYDMGVNGQLLFYNIENWFPFAVYLIAGSLTGYVRTKSTDEMRFAQKENELLRNKYLFLNDAYYGAIENKGQFKKQILGFQDSFGKIFDAVQRLDGQLAESVFLEGLKVMEDILENRAIAIYTLDEWQRFGRLVVCSNSLLPKLTKSIRMEDYPEMYEKTRQGQVWRNTQLLEEHPMYACGVVQENSIKLLIAIWEVNVEQHSMHYINMFQILCGLVQASFLRVLDYERLREDDTHYAGTRVMCAEQFDQVLRLRQQMKEAGVADYMLLHFEETDKKEVSDKLSGVIRATDTLGADEAGNIYLLLTQITGQSFRFVKSRLDGCGLQYRLAESEG